LELGGSGERMNDFIEQARNVLRIEAEAVQSLIERVNEGFVSAIDIIYSCKGRVAVTGMGKSGLIGKKIAATLASTGTPALFLSPAEGIHGDIGMVTRGDVVLAVSNSGDTDEIIRLLPALKRMEIKIISLTGNASSTLARSSDVHINVSVKEEACSMGVVPTASTTAALAMGDAIAVTLLNKRGFCEEDFALFHPGGSLGRRLLLTAADLMHTGDAIPSVVTGTLMKDAIIEISTKRLGITTVQDGKGRLMGVITDGDLRRGLEKRGEDFFSLTADDVMTHGPRTVVKNLMAARCVSLMEKHSITVLIITDSDNRVEGILHLHDLLKAGIV
jgi:arabinose-5-phosphate isomerase